MIDFILVRIWTALSQRIVQKAPQWKFELSEVRIAEYLRQEWYLSRIQKCPGPSVKRRGLGPDSAPIKIQSIPITKTHQPIVPLFRYHVTIWNCKHMISLGLKVQGAKAHPSWLHNIFFHHIVHIIMVNCPRSSDSIHWLPSAVTNLSSSNFQCLVATREGYWYFWVGADLFNTLNLFQKKFMVVKLTFLIQTSAYKASMRSLSQEGFWIDWKQ